MASLAGHWKMVSSENFDEFMQAIGVGYVMRKLANSTKPSQEITVDGEKVTIKTVSTMKTTEIHFTFGQEFDEVTADGANMKSVVTKESDTKWVQTQKPVKDGMERKITRELIGDEYVMSLEANGVVAKRRYHRE